ncbi:Cilia and flagella associated protein 46 [Balamuthia mandrillaris]
MSFPISTNPFEAILALEERAKSNNNNNKNKKAQPKKQNNNKGKQQPRSQTHAATKKSSNNAAASRKKKNGKQNNNSPSKAPAGTPTQPATSTPSGVEAPPSVAVADGTRGNTLPVLEPVEEELWWESVKEQIAREEAQLQRREHEEEEWQVVPSKGNPRAQGKKTAANQPLTKAQKRNLARKKKRELQKAVAGDSSAGDDDAPEEPGEESSLLIVERQDQPQQQPEQAPFEVPEGLPPENKENQRAQGHPQENGGDFEEDKRSNNKTRNNKQQRQRPQFSTPAEPLIPYVKITKLSDGNAFDLLGKLAEQEEKKAQNQQSTKQKKKKKNKKNNARKKATYTEPTSNEKEKEKTKEKEKVKEMDKEMGKEKEKKVEENHTNNNISNADLQRKREAQTIHASVRHHPAPGLPLPPSITQKEETEAENNRTYVIPLRRNGEASYSQEPETQQREQDDQSFIYNTTNDGERVWQRRSNRGEGGRGRAERPQLWHSSGRGYDGGRGRGRAGRGRGGYDTNNHTLHPSSHSDYSASSSNHAGHQYYQRRPYRGGGYPHHHHDYHETTRRFRREYNDYLEEMEQVDATMNERDNPTTFGASTTTTTTLFAKGLVVREEEEDLPPVFSELVKQEVGGDLSKLGLDFLDDDDDDYDDDDDEEEDVAETLRGGGDVKEEKLLFV